MRPPAAASMPRAEHISLEADSADARPAPRGPHRVRARLHWRNALRGIEAQFELADDHFLSVRYLQPRRGAKRYTVNLRFCQAKPSRSRHVAWVLLGVTLALVGATAALLALLLQDGFIPLSRDLLAGMAIAVFSAALASAALALHRTTESLEFTSLHGAVPLIRITGGLGSGRRIKAFCVELIKSINLAHAQFDRNAPTSLRDAMREHHRLRTAGALSETEYAACKHRILAAHTRSG